MTNKENKNESTSQPPDDSQAKGSSQQSNGTGGIWVAVIMIGLLVLIVAVEMLRSKH